MKNSKQLPKPYTTRYRVQAIFNLVFSSQIKTHWTKTKFQPSTKIPPNTHFLVGNITDTHQFTQNALKSKLHLENVNKTKTQNTPNFLGSQINQTMTKWLHSRKCKKKLSLWEFLPKMKNNAQIAFETSSELTSIGNCKYEASHGSQWVQNPIIGHCHVSIIKATLELAIFFSFWIPTHIYLHPCTCLSSTPRVFTRSKIVAPMQARLSPRSRPCVELSSFFCELHLLYPYRTWPLVECNKG